MSLIRTLAKVAVGVALAKGASSMMKKRGTSNASAGGTGGLGDLLQGMTGANAGSGQSYGGAHSQNGGDLQDMLGGLLGGRGQGSAIGQGGLGGLLDQLGGGGAQPGGGLQDLLGGLTGGGGGAAGGLGGLLGGLAGAVGSPRKGADRGFGEVLNSQFDEVPEPALEPSSDQEMAAALMLRAMIQATKADGDLDDAEKQRLIERLGGEVDAGEAQFVQEEMNRPLDIESLVRDTPQAMAPQVYAVSVLGIDLDSQAEAQYLHQLAEGFGLEPRAVNSIHEQLGVPALYA